jgi:hypothetical protein
MCPEGWELQQVEHDHSLRSTYYFCSKGLQLHGSAHHAHKIHAFFAFQMKHTLCIHLDDHPAASKTSPRKSVFPDSAAGVVTLQSIWAIKTKWLVLFPSAWHYIDGIAHILNLLLSHWHALPSAQHRWKCQLVFTYCEATACLTINRAAHGSLRREGAGGRGQRSASAPFVQRTCCTAALTVPVTQWAQWLGNGVYFEKGITLWQICYLALVRRYVLSICQRWHSPKIDSKR